MKRVLVIGDVISDVYRDCYFKKMCPDAPDVRAIVMKDGEKVVPGGAANVAVNLAALSSDCVVDLIGVIDRDCAWATKSISKNRVNMEFSYVVDQSVSLRKERILLDGEPIVRVDQCEQIVRPVLDPLEKLIDSYYESCSPDLVILSDYRGGMFARFKEQILRYRDRLLIDTKETDLSQFDGSLMIKLNKEEAGHVFLTDAAPERFCRGLVVTLGAKGACLYVRIDQGGGKSLMHTMVVRGCETPVVDVCGCGDTFLAGLAASLLMNGDMFSAVQFANAAASTVVGKHRTAVADLKRTLELAGREEK